MARYYRAERKITSAQQTLATTFDVSLVHSFFGATLDSTVSADNATFIPQGVRVTQVQ